MNKEQARQAFKKYDKDNSGKITEDEFCQLCFELYQIPNTERNYLWLDGIFEAADGKGFFNIDDGKLNFDEFYKIVSIMPQKFVDVERDLARVIFTLVDSNHSGKINVNELRNFMKKLGMNTSTAELKQSIKAFDENGSGKMDFEEFFSMYMQV